MDIRKLAYLFVVLGVVITALWPVMLSLAKTVNVFEFLFYENLVAMAGSLIFMVALGKLGSLREIIRNKASLAMIAAVAVLNYIIPDFGMLYGEHFISASLATVIFRTYPILMLLFIPIILKERITKYQFAALGLGFVGIALLFNFGMGISLTGTTLLGIGLVFGVALATALALVIMKRYVHETVAALFMFNFIGFVAYTALFLISGAPGAAISLTGWTSIVYAGLIYSVVYAYSFYYALKTLKTTMVTNLFYFGIFLTFIFANLILGEPISLLYIVAAGLIGVGAYIQKLDRSAGAYRSKSTALNTLQIFDVTGAFIETKEKEISQLIKNGGRVFAVKVSNEFKATVGNLASSTRTPCVITRLESRCAKELKFVDEVLGTDANEMAVVVAGGVAECEEFIGELPRGDSL